MLFEEVNYINFSILAVGAGMTDIVGHQQNHQLFQSKTIS